VRVDTDFAEEFPDANASSTEAYASLARTGTALLAEIGRCVTEAFDMPHAAATALAVVDGAASPLTPSEISERVLVPSATMTSTLDLLESRGWIVRQTNPDDRRSFLVEITVEGRATADRILAGIRAIELAVMAGLTEAERKQLLRLLTKVLERAAAVADAPALPLEGRRVRPRRLDAQP
jgi:DNA-binding MarR family transcriptional regulator